MADERQNQAVPYRAEDVQVLWSPQQVRRRPGMYVGDLGQKGLHRLLFELVANSLAEAAEGYGRSLAVRVKTGGSVEIQDGGRGIAAAPCPGLGKPVLEATFTDLRHRGRGPGDRAWPVYFVIANAVSEWLHVESRHEGRAYRQEFRRGEPVGPVHEVGTCTVSGLTLTFKPDPAIFTEPRFSYAVIRDKLREHAFLQGGLRASVSDEAAGKEERFEFEDGIRSFVKWLNRGRRPLHREVLVVRGEQAGVRFEAGMQWCRRRDETLRSFVNNTETTFGGPHVAGFREALTRSLNSFARQEGLTDIKTLKGDDACRGLTAIISVRMADPLFGSATKLRLDSEEPRGIVRAGVGGFLREFLKANPGVGETILRAVAAREG